MTKINTISDRNNRLKIHQIPVSELRIAKFNPRKWDAEAAKQLSESIRRFGLVDPIILNSAPKRRNVVIGGNFRLKVAKDLGFTDVPVVYVHLSNIKTEQELNLRLNRNTGEWDLDLLKSFDVDLLLDVGFDDSDLSNIWDDNLGVEDDEFDVEMEIAKIKEPKTKPGDLIYFGKDGWHRLLCTDSTNPTEIARLVGSDKVSMLNYDPPYNIGLDYNKGFGTIGKYGSRKVNDRKGEQEYRSFLKTTLQNGLAHSNPDTNVFCWCDETYIGLIQNLYEELGIDVKRVCLWIKNSQNPTPQVAFNKAYEPCVYGTLGSPYIAPNVTNLNEILNQEVGTGNRLPDDILDLFNIWLVKRDATSDYEHPTQKPPSLYEKPLRRCSKAGDIILDLFAGSGPLLIAADQLKRRAFLTEIDPVFCDVIVARYQQLTGKEVTYQ